MEQVYDAAVVYYSGFGGRNRYLPAHRAGLARVRARTRASLAPRRLPRPSPDGSIVPAAFGVNPSKTIAALIGRGVEHLLAERSR